MKLYTEIQVYHMLRRARFHNQDDTEMFTDEYLISQVTPIELPSDADIEVMSKRWGIVSEAYLSGAKYVKEQILKQIESC